MFKNKIAKKIIKLIRKKTYQPNFLPNSSLKLKYVRVASTWHNRLGHSKNNPIDW
jgi:hypothetical protein